MAYCGWKSYDGKPIFDDCNSTQCEWQTDTSEFYLNIESFDEEVPNHSWKYPKNIDVHIVSVEKSDQLESNESQSTYHVMP